MTDISGAMEAAQRLLEWDWADIEDNPRQTERWAHEVARALLSSHPQRDGEGNRGSEPQVPAPINPVAKAIDAAGYTRAYLEEASVIQMAAGIDVAMGPIEGREQNPMCAATVERRKHSRRLAHAAFRVIPNFALNLPRPPTPSPTGTELALDEAKRHISRLASFWMENPGWYEAAESARAFIGGVPLPTPPDEIERLRVIIAEQLAALKAVVRVADRKTIEFDAARAAIARATKAATGEKAGLIQASESLARISSLRKALSVEQLTVMILAARREPGIWRADVQAKFLAEKINAALSSHPEDGGIREALESILSILDHCTVSSGTCMCGDDMEKHAGPMTCGHSPVDMGQYHMDAAYKAALAALNPAPLPIGEEREKN